MALKPECSEREHSVMLNKSRHIANRQFSGHVNILQEWHPALAVCNFRGQLCFLKRVTIHLRPTHGKLQ